MLQPPWRMDVAGSQSRASQGGLDVWDSCHPSEVGQTGVNACWPFLAYGVRASAQHCFFFNVSTTFFRPVHTCFLPTMPSTCNLAAEAGQVTAGASRANGRGKHCLRTHMPDPLQHTHIS